MAKRGSKKATSIEQEDFVANAYEGVRSPTSGASITDGGDVRAKEDGTLFECKYVGSPAYPPARKSTLLVQMEKIAMEAAEEGLSPALALRFWCPDSPLSNWQGWVDLTVRTMGDDVLRSEQVKMGKLL